MKNLIYKNFSFAMLFAVCTASASNINDNNITIIDNEDGQKKPMLLLRAKSPENRVVDYVPSNHTTALDSIASEAEKSFILGHNLCVVESCSYRLKSDDPYQQCDLPFGITINGKTTSEGGYQLAMILKNVDGHLEKYVRVLPTLDIDYFLNKDVLKNQGAFLNKDEDKEWDFDYDESKQLAECGDKVTDFVFQHKDLKKSWYFYISDLSTRSILLKAGEHLKNDIELYERIKTNIEKDLVPWKNGMDSEIIKFYRHKSDDDQTSDGELIIDDENERCWGLETDLSIAQSMKLEERANSSFVDDEKSLLGKVDDDNHTGYNHTLEVLRDELYKHSFKSCLHNLESISHRNYCWSDALSLLESDTIVVVGGLHFPGPFGIINLLTVCGWEWSQIFIHDDGSIEETPLSEDQYIHEADVYYLESVKKFITGDTEDKSFEDMFKRSEQQ